MGWLRSSVPSRERCTDNISWNEMRSYGAPTVILQKCISCFYWQAAESIQAEDESAKLCKRRIEHLKEHSSDQPASVNVWKKKRMDRMMVEHLLRCGYYNTAVKLARQSGIEVCLHVVCLYVQDLCYFSHGFFIVLGFGEHRNVSYCKRSRRVARTTGNRDVSGLVSW